MMLRFLCCFLALIQTGWSASQYLFENNRRAAYGIRNNKHTPTLQEHLQQIVLPKDYNVEYFFFNAPDDKLDIEALKKITPSLKKRRQVIFIKTPENNALRNLIQNMAPQKTHIYVLNKEANYANLQQKLQTFYKNAQHKPEVHFIKYRNLSEFERVQKSIIDKYGAASNKVHTRSVTVYNNNEPLPKDYARNFLPTGVDVVPGSSYIPLVFY